MTFSRNFHEKIALYILKAKQTIQQNLLSASKISPRTFHQTFHAYYGGISAIH